MKSLFNSIFNYIAAILWILIYLEHGSINWRKRSKIKMEIKIINVIAKFRIWLILENQYHQTKIPMACMHFEVLRITTNGFGNEHDQFSSWCSFLTLLIVTQVFCKRLSVDTVYFLIESFHVFEKAFFYLIKFPIRHVPPCIFFSSFHSILS